MRKLKKIMNIALCTIMAFVLLFPSNVDAAMAKSDSHNTDGAFVSSDIESEIVQKEVETDLYNSHSLDQSDEESFSVQEVIEEGEDEEEEGEGENTDPNNAYVVENGDVVQGVLSATSEMRWYGFIVDQSSKATIFLQCVDTVDADVYLFALDQSTYQLNLIGGSATAGAGISEFSTEVLDSGIYYIAVSSYDGSGQFAFAFYLTQDVTNEVNDSVSNATTVSTSTTVTGVIDSPYDYDYYSFEVTSPMIMEFTTNVGSYAFDWISVDSNAHVYKISTLNEFYRFEAGNYCFRIYSTNGNYNANSSYSITLNKIGNVSSNANATYYMINKMAHIVFQSDSNGGNMYVNGHAININYNYYVNASNSAGTQIYDISMTTPADLKAKIYQNQFLFDDADTTIYYGMTMPDAVYYKNGSRGVGPNNIHALELSLYSSTNFYHIHCTCSGAYASNNMYKDVNFVTVFINPDTGTLVDIEHINYFYEYASGSNSMTFTRPYSTHTKYLYPYYNQDEPKTW